MRSQQHLWFGLVCLGVALSLGGCHQKFQPDKGQDRVEATPITLDRVFPKRTTFGDLKLVAARRLSKKGSWTAERFGGLSEIIVRGPTAQVISDNADRFVLPTAILEGPLLTAPIQLERLTDEAGRTFDDFQWSDSEGAALGRDGTLYVSFERHDRILRYRSGERSQRLELIGLPNLPKNEGMEGLSLTADETALFIATEPGDFLLCPLKGLRAVCKTLQGPRPPLGYLMTSADRLERPEGFGARPGADLFVTTYRSLGPLGWGAKIAVLAVSKGRVERWILASLRTPQRIDNMEGISAVKNADGSGWRIYVVSDDNFLRLQHTTVLVFDLSAKTLGTRLSTRSQQ